MRFPLFAAFLVALMSGTAFAQTARIVDTEILPYRDREVMLRAEVTVKKLAHRWLAVYFQVRVGSEPLVVDGKNLLVKWGDLFTPADPWTPVTWSELRVGLPFETLEKATNLPKATRSLLWIICDVWDPKDSKYIAAGWEAREPLIVDVDAAGMITGYELFNTLPPDTPAVSDWKTKAGKLCRLELEHLKIKAGTTLTRTVGPKHDVRDWLHLTKTEERADGAMIRTNYLTPMEELNRGGFFAPIETADQALELVALGHREAVIIPDQGSFAALVADLKAKNFTAAILNETPPGYGFEATEIPGVGWRVRGLLFETEGLNTKPEGVVIYVDYAVATDGRMGFKPTPCIHTGLDCLLGVAALKDAPRLPKAVTVTEEIVSVPELTPEIGEYLGPAEWPKPEDR